MKPDKPSPVDIDAAIDRAVRSMMSAEPRAGMRQRVLSRINEAPRRAFPRLRLVTVGGVIAVIAVAVGIRVVDAPTPHHEPSPIDRVPPIVVAPPLPREQSNATRIPSPIAAAPPTRPTPPPSQRVPRGLVVAQSLPSLEADDPPPSRGAAPSPAKPELQRLRMPPLPPIEELETPVESIPAITLPPIGISSLPPIAPLQGPVQ